METYYGDEIKTNEKMCVEKSNTPKIDKRYSISRNLSIQLCSAPTRTGALIISQERNK